MNIPFLKRHPLLGTALEWSIKLIIFALLAGAIYKQVFLNKDIHVIRENILQALKTNNRLLALAVCLMFVNWGLETVKWRYLVQRVEPISLLRAFMAILCGVTFTMFTPNRVGEYGGRFLFLKEPLRPSAFQATILGSVAQIIATLLFGVIGLALYFMYGDNAFKMNSAFGLVWIVVAVPLLMSIYFSADVILGKLPFNNRWKNVIFAWVHYSGTELWTVLLLAFARYAVYTIQYLLLLQVFLGQPAFNLHYITGVSLTFLVQTVIPSIALFDIGIRGTAALTLLSDGTNGIAVVAAALSLWLINLVLPSIIGAFIILGKKFFDSPAGER